MLQVTEDYTALYDTYFRTIQEMVNVSNDTVANQLSAINTLLVIVSLVLVLVGAGISLYINAINHKLKKIKMSVEAKRKEVETWAKNIADIDMMIKENISGLYQKLRLEETKALLQRLCDEPSDINNLGRLLLARDIPKDMFGMLKDAYCSLLQNCKERLGNSYDVDTYHILFFQHFLEESLRDDYLRPEIVESFNVVVKCAFKNDLVKSTEGLCRAINDPTVIFDREDVLARYLSAINSSRYSKSKEVKEILQCQLNARGLLTEAIEKCRSENVCLFMFCDEGAENKED